MADKTIFEEHLPLLARTRLFSGVTQKEIAAMLGCLHATLHTYQKGEYVLHQGEYVDTIMVVAAGRLHIQKNDYWGNLSIVNDVHAGDMFGEAYAAPNAGPLLNDVVALEDTVVISFDAKHILTQCTSACHFHANVTKNLFYAISDRNRTLVRKIGYLSERSTRRKIMAYLSDESKRQHNASFTIPFNRQQLADFLAVDRSALSTELGKMRDEGLIEFQRNSFTLL